MIGSVSAGLNSIISPPLRSRLGIKWYASLLISLFINSVVLVISYPTKTKSHKLNAITTTEHFEMRLLRNNENKHYDSRILSTTQRIYGRDNAEVRREISRIENSSYRSKTGLPPNPDHIVPYENHPYEKQRKLSTEADNDSLTEGSDNDRETEENSSLFRPIRIHVVTDAMAAQRNSQNSAAIDFIEKEILPRTVEYWSSTLSVVPVEGNLRIDPYDLANRIYCGDSEFSEVPEDHMESGVPGADLIWYVSATPSSRFCGPNTLAVAVACNFDQFDRPTAGAINFCVNQVQIDASGSATPAVIQDNVDVATHEAAHILGMSSNAFRYFYDPETGEARTSRPFKTSTVTCVDGVDRSLVLPAQNTLVFRDDANGQRSAIIVTPKVRTVARNQFNCQSLDGAPLENQPTGSESCTGDHWEERTFYPEALTSVISPTTNINSPLTLALMEDSGWYVANYSNSVLSPWGHGVGCDFVNKKCLDTDASGDTFIPDFAKGFFCKAPNARGCAAGLTHKMACTVLDYSLYYPPIPPPSRYQYFTTSDTLGGPEEVDYCPVFGSTYSGLKPEQLECANPKNLDQFNIFSEYYGDNSKCFETNTGSGRCYEAQCILSERVLKVNVRGTWYTCEKDFQEITFQTNAAGILDGVLTCPRLSTACPDFYCPANCAGRGTCDFENVVNGTVVPKCRCFNQNDTSPACTESYVPKGKYLMDDSSLTNKFNTGFFDPLVAVFVDHPDTWSTTSWAWAAGLFAIFLLMIVCICASFWPEKKKRKVNTRHRRR